MRIAGPVVHDLPAGNGLPRLSAVTHRERSPWSEPGWGGVQADGF